LLLIVAILILLLVHTPFDEGNSCVVLLIQIADSPLNVAIGFAFTVIGLDPRDTQPVLLFVNTNVAVPAAKPVTIPAFVIVATDVLLDVHVPPFDGLIVVEDPTQIADDPAIDILGLPFTVIRSVPSDWQPMEEVNTNEVTP
jgi:hypothetical protein